MVEDAAEDASEGTPSERVVRAATRLLAREGPASIKARAVAAEAGMSTMVVYSRFGGVPELMHAVAESGFRRLERAFIQQPSTDDPLGDLFSRALAVLKTARANPHLYDLMFGLSARATYRASNENQTRKSGESPAFHAAHAHIALACRRLSESGRIRDLDPDVLAAMVWSMVHGYISLEMAGHFDQTNDPVLEVLVPLADTFAVGLGDSPNAAHASHMHAMERAGASGRSVNGEIAGSQTGRGRLADRRIVDQSDASQSPPGSSRVSE